MENYVKFNLPSSTSSKTLTIPMVPPPREVEEVYKSEMQEDVAAIMKAACVLDETLNSLEQTLYYVLKPTAPNSVQALANESTVPPQSLAKTDLQRLLLHIDGIIGHVKDIQSRV